MSDLPLSGVLFARDSFWEGMGRILDFGDTMTDYNYSLTEQQADRLAIRADWRAIGQDIARVFAVQLELDLGHAA